MENFTQTKNASKIAFLLAIVSFVACVAGCGGGRDGVRIEGSVTLDGAPLPAAMIVFTNSQGESRSAEVKPDGSFSMTELLTGDYEVAVKTSQFKPARVARPPVSSPKGGSPVGSGSAETTYVAIPTKYENPKTSGLKVTVDKPRDDIEIKLES